MAARGAPRGGAAPDYDRFEVDEAGENTAVLNRGRKKAKGLGPVTWLALITFAIIAVSLLDAHHRAVRPAAARGRRPGRTVAHCARGIGASFARPRCLPPARPR